MNQQQIEHLKQIVDEASRRLSQKYSVGAAEHGGNLWDKDAMWILDQAIDEAIDQVTYLYTLKQKLEKKRSDP